MKTDTTTQNPDVLPNPGVDWRPANYPSLPSHRDKLLEARRWDWGKTK